MHRTRTRLAALATTGVAAAALGLAALAAPAQAATAQAAPTPSAKAAACDRTAWESPVQGSPHVRAGDRSGDHLYHDGSGFHLRVTHAKGERRVYTGTVTASSAMRYTPVRLEKGDLVKLSADRRTLTFAFVDDGRIDGADFHTDCASSLTLSRLHVGDADLAASRVFLGAHRTHPEHVPFTVHRVA